MDNKEEDRINYSNHREMVLGDWRIVDLDYMLAHELPMEISGDHITRVLKK